MLHGLNLLWGENLQSGANCAYEQGLNLSYNYLAGSLINASTYKCADSPEGYRAFLRLFVFFFPFICLIAVLSPRTKANSPFFTILISSEISCRSLARVLDLSDRCILASRKKVRVKKPALHPTFIL